MRAAILLVPALILLFAPPAAPQAQEAKREKTINGAVGWLLKAQNRDGSWGLDARSTGDITCTALASLALMADGTTERNGRSRSVVRALRDSLKWLLVRARRMRGDIAGTTTTLIQSKLGQKVHNFFATVYFTQIYGMRPRWAGIENLQEIRELLGKMGTTIVRSQEADGSWHKNTFGSLKATCMAWLALRAASSSGIDVEDAAVDKTLRFIQKQYNPTSKLYDRMTGARSYQTIYATSVCIRVMYAMGHGDKPEARGAAKALLKFIKSGFGGQFLSVEGEDYLSSTMISQALMFEEGELWKEWFPYITDLLAKKQARDGSWTGTACISGRTFATSCALWTLRTPNRLLPISER